MPFPATQSPGSLTVVIAMLVVELADEKSNRPRWVLADGVRQVADAALVVGKPQIGAAVALLHPAAGSHIVTGKESVFPVASASSVLLVNVSVELLVV